MAKEKFSLFTKRLYRKDRPGDFVTVIRGTSILHGEFYDTDENGWNTYGSNRFGKLHGNVATYLPKEDTLFIKRYNKGERSKHLTVIRKGNGNSIPYHVTEMYFTSDPTEQEGTIHDIATFCVAREGQRTIQNILKKKINTTLDGKATPKTIEQIFEPSIGGPTFPAVINIYKDIELGKFYTLWMRHTQWMRPEEGCGYRIIAMARSSAEEDKSIELGYRSHFDELVIFEEPHDIGGYPAKDPAAFAELFDAQQYEKLKEEDSCKGLFITFEQTSDGLHDHINHAVMKVTDEDGNEEEIKTDIKETDVELLLFDLQRGSGHGVAEVRASVLTNDNDAGKSEVSGSSPEDVQRSGTEASSVPDGNQDRIDSASDNQA